MKPMLPRPRCLLDPFEIPYSGQREEHHAVFFGTPERIPIPSTRSMRQFVDPSKTSQLQARSSWRPQKVEASQNARELHSLRVIGRGWPDNLLRLERHGFLVLHNKLLYTGFIQHLPFNHGSRKFTKNDPGHKNCLNKMKVSSHANQLLSKCDHYFFMLMITSFPSGQCAARGPPTLDDLAKVTGMEGGRRCTWRRINHEPQCSIEFIN